MVDSGYEMYVTALEIKILLAINKEYPKITDIEVVSILQKLSTKLEAKHDIKEN